MSVLSSHVSRPLALSALLAVAPCTALLVGGCGSRQAAAPPAPQATKAPPRVSDETIAKHKPNEAGAIMVLMYHRFEADEPDNDLNRKPESFRKDLEMLYERNYHPVTALEMVENNMDVPAGKTPVVLTFDDALPSQFRVVTGSDSESHIDPNCAVGILETFNKKHPEWPTKGTFFVLPKEAPNPDPFSQSEYVAEKFTYLQKHGYEIANHTSTHQNLRGLAADKIQWELATAVNEIKTLAPDAEMKTLALPYGKLPRQEAAQKSLIEGQSGGHSYKHEAVFLAAWRPVMAPTTKPDKSLSNGGQFCLFEPYRLERIKADAREAKLPGTFEYWLKYFDEHPAHRYVSDGNAQIVTVPAAQEKALDQTRLKEQQKILQVYGGSGGKNDTGEIKDLSVKS